MTIRQYQTLAKAVADKIIELGGDPQRVRNLKNGTLQTLQARDAKKYGDEPCSYASGSSNATVEFDTMSNPNNPNYKFRTLKPGSMSAYSSLAHVNVDLAEYNFDSAQFAKLLSAVNADGWYIAF